MNKEGFRKILREIKVSRSLTFFGLMLVTTSLRLERIKFLRKPYFSWLSLIDRIFV